MAISIIYLSCLFLTLVIQLSATSLVSNTTTTWQEAVTFCSREGMILRKERLGVDEKRSEKFWTRIYEKEHFVYLIGCFNATDVLMYNVSAAQCPGKCLRQEPFMFALSGISKDKCTCVYDSLPQAQAGQCVNSLHILVFGVHDTKSSEDNCVRLECEGNTSRLTHVNCDERENLVCNNEISPGNFTWRNAAEKCLQNSGRLSDVNFKTFCQTYNTSAWFGFGTVISEEEYDTNKDDTDLNPKRCQSCAESCMFEDCNTQRITSCETETVNSENKSVTLNVSFKTTTSLSILSTSDMITTEEIISTGEAMSLVSNATMSWQEAVEFCSRKGMILRKDRLGLVEAESENFWTRIYEKEHFVYLMGCFKAKYFHTSTNMTEMECLTTCLHKQPFMYATSRNSKGNWCSCGFDELQEIQTHCDYEKDVLVLGTLDTKHKSSREYCIQMNCKRKPILHSVKCDEERDLFCNNTEFTGNYTWRNAAEKCRMKSGRLADLDFKKFCKTHHIKAWTGFGTVISTEEYTKKSYVDNLVPKRCQSCAKHCNFENCSEEKKVMCETLPENVTKPTSISTEYRTRGIIPLHTRNTSGYTKYLTPQQTRKTTQQTKRYYGQVSNQTIDTSSNVNATEAISHTMDTNDSILNGNVLIYSVSSLLSCILIFGIVCLLYMRRKRNRRRKEIFAPQTVREELYELADNSQLENADNGQVQANNGLCTNDSTTPGSVHGEDIYNHLWEKTTDPNQDEESVYNRCIEGTDDNTYDVSFRKKFQFPSRDSVYHHVTMCDTSNG